MTHTCDIIIFGAGIAGLWLGNTLQSAGYSVIIIEKDKIGAGQTLASQGMIHGGQKYTLGGAPSSHAFSISEMPERWNNCFAGRGEVDLSSARFLSDIQIMWPAGSILADAAVFGAAQLVNAATSKMQPGDFPDVLKQKKKFTGPVYKLPEKVLETRSLLEALSRHLKGRIFRGEATPAVQGGQVVVDGQTLTAQMIIFTAGVGNETALSFLKVSEKRTQRRPLRQVMVKGLPYSLFGHGIVGAPKPRATITSHPINNNEYVWYLGGNIAEQGAKLNEEETIAFAKKELQDMFPDIDWHSKEWATWYGDRAEPYDEKGALPAGPFIYERGQVLVAWPTKLTFTPALSDSVFLWLKEKKITPMHKALLPSLPLAEMGQYPWETAKWRKLS